MNKYLFLFSIFATPLSLSSCATDGSSSGPPSLTGTAWRLEDLAGAGVLDRVEATLEFMDGGKIAGRGSCNRFFGSAKIEGQSLTIGPVGATRMACPEAVMNQETRYFQALQNAARYRIESEFLLIDVKGMDKPLRFIRAQPSNAK